MIDMNRNRFPDGNFRVTLGHASVEVAGRTPSEAIARARLQLSNDMPRLYDVIHRLEDDRFHVEAVDG